MKPDPIEFEQPDIRPFGDKKYRLNLDWPFQWERPGHKDWYYKIIVKENFIYDGASTSRLGPLFGFRKDGIMRAAALPHDVIYKADGHLVKKYPDAEMYKWVNGEWIRIEVHFTRKESDWLFNEINKVAGMNPFKRKVAYFFIRAGGWLKW